MDTKKNEIALKVTLDTTEFDKKVEAIRDEVGGVERLATANFSPSDILIVETPLMYKRENTEKIENHLSERIGCKVRLLCGGMKAAAIMKAE